MDGSIQPEEEELNLVRRFRAGDPEAFRLLMAHYEPRIFAFLLKMLGDRENTQDILQETLITIFQELPAWKPGLTGISGHPLAPWIYRIATNKALSLLRKQAVRERYRDQSTRKSKHGGQANWYFLRKSRCQWKSVLSHANSCVWLCSGLKQTKLFV